MQLILTERWLTVADRQEEAGTELQVDLKSARPGWHDRRDSRVTCEVRAVQSQDMGDPVGLHHCDESGVVNLFSLHGVIHYKLAPQRISCRNIREQLHQSLKGPQAPVRFGNGKPETTACGRGTGTHVPKLGHVLGRDDRFVAASGKDPKGRSDGGVLRIGPLHKAQ